MKKYGYVLLFLMFIGGQSYGQCPTIDTLFLTSQESLDAFITDYPNCTEFAGNIDISDIMSNDPIIDLLGLQNINSVGGYIRIEHCENLMNLNGLDNLISVDD